MILYKLLRGFSICFPFITEEIFKELYNNNGSIHLTEIKPFNYDFNEELINSDNICDIISIVRGEKSINNLSIKTNVELLDISLSKELKIRDIDNGYKINEVRLER